MSSAGSLGLGRKPVVEVNPIAKSTVFELAEKLVRLEVPNSQY
jgi:hypothetical protein